MYKLSIEGLELSDSLNPSSEGNGGKGVKDSPFKVFRRTLSIFGRKGTTIWGIPQNT